MTSHYEPNSGKALEDGTAATPANVDDSYRHENMSASRYFATRFSTLKPPMNKAPNPFKLMLLLNRRQWAFFFVGFIAWVCFLSLSLSPALMPGNING
jgi:hypothetical protein